jgi:hypothetical protein
MPTTIRSRIISFMERFIPTVLCQAIESSNEGLHGQAEAVKKQQPAIRGDSKDDQDHDDSPVQAIHGTPQP